MVPFAEVVLLTAMEYQRTEEDDDVTKPGSVKVVPEKKRHKKFNLAWLLPNIASLKTLGEFLEEYLCIYYIDIFQRRRCCHH